MIRAIIGVVKQIIKNKFGAFADMKFFVFGHGTPISRLKISTDESP
jgi:hypothetical protein